MKCLGKHLLSLIAAMILLFGMVPMIACVDTPPKDLEAGIEKELPEIRSTMTSLGVPVAGTAVPGEPIHSYLLTREAILGYAPSTRLSGLLQEKMFSSDKGEWQVPMLVNGEAKALVTMHYRRGRGWFAGTISGWKDKGFWLGSTLPQQPLEARGISGECSKKWVTAGPTLAELLLITPESGEDYLAFIYVPAWLSDFKVEELYDVTIVMQALKDVIATEAPGPPDAVGGGLAVGGGDGV